MATQTTMTDDMGIRAEIRDRRKRPKSEAEIDRFWNLAKNEGEDTAELVLYGEISSYSWYEDKITPQAFEKELKELGAVKEITVRINSPGGDVFAAFAIRSRLLDHPAKIHVKIDGMAASAATIIATAADISEIPAAGIYMIHDPAMGMGGYYTTAELEAIISELETIKNAIVECYTARSGKSAEEIKELMRAESWYTGREAVENGFCDKLMFENVEMEPQDNNRVVINSVAVDLSRFAAAPERLLGQKAHNDINGPKNKNEEEKRMTLEELKTQHPELVNALKNEITGAGGTDTKNAAEKERERIKQIEDCTLPGFEDLANAAKYENPISPQDFAMQIIAAQKESGKNFITQRDDDINNSGLRDITPESNGGMGEEDADPFGDAIDRVLPETK